MTTCLPDGLWTCETFAWAKRFKRRLWDFCMDVARELANDPDAANWPSIEMAIRLSCSVRQVERDAEAARDLGIMDPDSFALVFETARSAAASKLPQVSSSALRMRRLRERRQRECDADSAKCDASHSVTEASHLALDVTESASHLASQSEPPSYSLAEASLANKESSFSSAKAEAKPRESTNTKGDYPNRAKPNTEEICKLEAAGWTIVQIEEAIKRVSARPRFRGSARWDRYLEPVLVSLFGKPGQGAMPMIHSVPGGVAKPPEAAPPVTAERTPPALRPGAPDPPRGEFDVEAVRKWSVWVRQSIGDDEEELTG